MRVTNNIINYKKTPYMHALKIIYGKKIALGNYY